MVQHTFTSGTNPRWHKPRPMNPVSLKRLLQARERMIQARQGHPSLDSTEIVRQMREERSQYLAEL